MPEYIGTIHRASKKWLYHVSVRTYTMDVEIHRYVGTTHGASNKPSHGLKDYETGLSNDCYGKYPTEPILDSLPPMGSAHTTTLFVPGTSI